MRLYDVIKALPEGTFDSVDGFFFSKMGKDSVFEWLDYDTGSKLDYMFFLGHSADKDIVDAYNKVKEFGKYKLNPLSYFYDATLTKFKDKWNKLEASLEEEINPLYNEYYEIVDTPNLTTSTSNSGSVDTYGFNSSTAVHQSEGDNTGSVSQTGTRNTTYKGMRGQNFSDALMKQIEQLKWNFYEQIFQDVDTIITLPKYTI